MSFWSELKRRNVYKVGVAYAIVAWLLIQAVAIIFPAQHLPSWTVTFVIALLIIGFPLVLIFAYAFEITPTGLKRTKQVPLHESITHITGRRLNYILAGVIVIAVAFILFDNYYLDRRAVEKEVVSTETAQAPSVIDEEKTQKTIAVIPFVNLSPDPDQEYFVDGLSEELLNSLCQIPDLRVTSRTSSFTFKGSDKTLQEIASVLGVENILEGSVRKADNMLRVTAQLVRATDDFHLWSKTYDRELKDIFSIQEDIASSVADELKVTLGIGHSFQMIGGTDNEKAYSLYLSAKGTRDLLDNYALESINAAIAIDPEFASAWALKSSMTLQFVQAVPPNQYAAVLEEGINAAQKAIEIEPNLSEPYMEIGHSKTLKGDWIGAELAYRKASELITEPSLKYKAFYILHYMSVGDLERSLELNVAARKKDPLSQVERGRYIYILGLIGDRQQAEKEYEFGRELFGDQFWWGDEGITLVRLLSIGNPISRDEILMPGEIFAVAKEHLESPEEGIKELRQLFNDNDQLVGPELKQIVTCAAYFGDTVLAMDAIEKLVRIDACETLYLWFPAMKEIRQLPRFKELVREIGLVDYWEKFGWPDLCRPLDNGDFECD